MRWCGRCVAIILYLVAISAAAESNRDFSGSYFGEPIPKLSRAQREDFDRGYELFVRVWTTKSGLGPAFNAASCLSCHNVPMAGGSGVGENTFVFIDTGVGGAATAKVFRRFKTNPDGSLTSLSPPESLVPRRAPSLFGLGLLEAVSVEEIMEWADTEDVDGDGISGRVSVLKGGIGRFGWEATGTDIAHFVTNALMAEMGLIADTGDTAGEFKPLEYREVSAEEVRLITQFIRYLGPPPQIYRDSDTIDVTTMIHVLGCHLCHRPSLTASNMDMPEIKGRVFFSYTDLLLHDMGDRDDEGKIFEIRTPALWGVSSAGPPYLHDARAADLDKAIRLHAGEAEAAAEAYRIVTEDKRKILISFLQSL